MQSDPDSSSREDKPATGGGPPLAPASEPSGANSPPVSLPPPPLPKEDRRPVEKTLAILLSLCLALFLADSVVSLVDDSLILFFDVHALTMVRGMLFFFTALMLIVVYGLMGLTPTIPKRLFLPITLFYLAAGMASAPLLIYFYGRVQQIAWGISACQVIVGLGILYKIQNGFKFHWPLIAENQLEGRRFSWRNLSVFLLANIFVLLPAIIVYFVVCAALAVDHFSEGFLTVRPEGLTVQVRKYVRADGKTIQLFPMSHIGESDFYQKLTKSFPTNSIVLMEGVTDDKNLLTNKVTYKRMATTLGLAEQQKEFVPQNVTVRADVDVEEFTKNTIDFLNLTMLLHSKGVNAETLMQLTQYSPPVHFEEQLWDDLLKKRNRRLMEEIQARLLHWEHIIVPWGVAHMPEIAREIQNSGFRLSETQEYVAIRFGSGGNKMKSTKHDQQWNPVSRD